MRDDDQGNWRTNGQLRTRKNKNEEFSADANVVFPEHPRMAVQKLHCAKSSCLEGSLLHSTFSTKMFLTFCVPRQNRIYFRQVPVTESLIWTRFPEYLSRMVSTFHSEEVQRHQCSFLRPCVPIVGLRFMAQPAVPLATLYLEIPVSVENPQPCIRATAEIFALLVILQFVSEERS